jgi:hypothetical protein
MSVIAVLERLKLRLEDCGFEASPGYGHPVSIKQSKAKQNRTKAVKKMLLRLWSNRNPHTQLVEMKNDASTLKNSFVVSGKVTHKISLCHSNPTLKFLPKKNENICPHEDLHAHVLSSISQNSQQLETT